MVLHKEILLGGYHWKYADDSKEADITQGKVLHRSVKCIETGIIYESLADAKRAIGASQSQILEACKKTNRTAGGYHWEAIDDSIKKIDSKTTSSKQVKCIETNKIYKSMKEAESETGINSSSISQACRKIIKQAGKLHWEYLKEGEE